VEKEWDIWYNISVRRDNLELSELLSIYNDYLVRIDELRGSL
jgi:hypothetical protein